MRTSILSLLFIFIVMIFFANPVFSQDIFTTHITSVGSSNGPHALYSSWEPPRDSNFWTNSMIKINPLNLLSGLVFGEEYGGTLQFPLLKKKTPAGAYYYYKVDAYIGGGFNQYYGVSGPNGNFPSGYTIRVGMYYFFSEKRKGYLSLQYFFRRWIFNNIIDYPNADSQILDPGISIGGSGDGIPDYRYNAIVNVNCYDIVYGNQVLKSKRVILDWYVGFGRRIKNIQQTIIGDYDGGLQYYTPRVTPFSFPDEIDKYIDIKAGFTIGFIL